jgi:UDP-N-acetylglucosamine 2-epimerase
LNILGETEKVTLAVNNYQIPSILLEHGATNYVSSISKYDISNMYPIFRDKIALWGDIQKNYLLEQRCIPTDRIFVTGSPRHEDFFKKIKSNKISSKKIILITPQVMTEFNALIDTDVYLRLEKLLIRIFKILENLPDTKIIVKMHPTLAPGNEYVKMLIHKLNPNAEILQLEPILDVVASCDIMLNINTELFPSTVLYEGLILKKPIMNITMMNENYEFEFIKDNDLQIKLIANGQKHLKKYFSNPTTASEKLANILISYSDELNQKQS